MTDAELDQAMAPYLAVAQSHDPTVGWELHWSSYDKAKAEGFRPPLQWQDGETEAYLVRVGVRPCGECGRGVECESSFQTFPFPGPANSIKTAIGQWLEATDRVTESIRCKACNT